MRPGPPAVCDGQVLHRRSRPAIHEFRHRVSYVWLDPDDPDELCRHHRLWSATHPAPARFRASDYGDGSARSLATQVRDDLGEALGRRPSGPVRMLTQVRRWGWLFNPMTMYVAWDADADVPVGAVLEVTNTPWKERHRYAIELREAGRREGEAARFRGRVRKVLHVSPFLDEQLDYNIDLWAGTDADATLDLAIDVVTPGTSDAVVTTRLQLDRRSATRRSLGSSLMRNVAPTHRVSAGIHVQAARLWAKRVPFVAHPRKREVEA
jgi:uncharacterized protein